MLYDIDFKVNQKLKRTCFESLFGRKYFATFLVNLITDTLYVAGARRPGPQTSVGFHRTNGVLLTFIEENSVGSLTA